MADIKSEENDVIRYSCGSLWICLYNRIIEPWLCITENIKYHTRKTVYFDIVVYPFGFVYTMLSLSHRMRILKITRICKLPLVVTLLVLLGEVFKKTYPGSRSWIPKFYPGSGSTTLYHSEVN
jgi:hypothetical protein